MEDLSGKQLGSYQLLAPLGQGGMAAVYKAFQPNMDRYVAIKLLPRHLAADPDYLARFHREARLIAQFQHPHIIPIFDFGESDGFTYLVMPLIKGDTLADRLKGRPLPNKQIESFISQIGDALDYAHSRGVIHRDVKPSNILIDERSNCLLADFGVARIIEIDSSLTQNGVAIGTPAYMSPEQGQGDKADHHSDIYSLGVILYEMTTGLAPFEAETPAAILMKQLLDPIVSPRQINPSISESLERVILKAMDKKPEDRFDSAGEMVAFLQDAFGAPAGNIQATGMPVVKPIPGNQIEIKKPTQAPVHNMRKNKWLLLAGLGLIVVVATGLIIPELNSRLNMSRPTDTGGRNPTLVSIALIREQTPTLRANATSISNPVSANQPAKAIRSEDILTLSQTSAKPDLPRMAFDSNGVLHVIWKEQVGNQTNIIHREMSSDGSWTEGENIIKNFGAVYPLTLQMITKPSGIVCAFFDSSLDQWYQRCFGSDSTKLSEKETAFLGVLGFASDLNDKVLILKNSLVYNKIMFDNLLLANGEGSYGPIDFVIDGSGRYHATWLVRNQKEDRIVYRSSSNQGSTWSDPIDLSLIDTQGINYGPKLFPSKDNHLLCAYMAGTKIVIRRWSSDLGWGETTTVPLSENDDPRLVGVASDLNGLLHIVFQEYQGMKYIHELPNGNWSKATSILDSSVLRMIDKPQIISDKDGNGYLLWAEDGDFSGIHFAKLPK